MFFEIRSKSRLKMWTIFYGASKLFAIEACDSLLTVKPCDQGDRSHAAECETERSASCRTSIARVLQIQSFAHGVTTLTRMWTTIACPLMKTLLGENAKSADSLLRW